MHQVCGYLVKKFESNSYKVDTSINRTNIMTFMIVTSRNFIVFFYFSWKGAQSLQFTQENP